MDFILEQMADTGPISAKEMFGEYRLYPNGSMFEMTCDKQLIMKHTPASCDYAPDRLEGIRRESLAVAKLSCSSRLPG